MEPKIDVNALLAAGLRGRTMHVPNMLLKLQDWPHGKRNKHYLRLRKIVDEILTRSAVLSHLSLDLLCPI